jgi:hypothetical protein
MVKWYGSDGSALNDKLVRNLEAAVFAANTGTSHRKNKVRRAYFYQQFQKSSW